MTQLSKRWIPIVLASGMLVSCAESDEARDRGQAYLKAHAKDPEVHKCASGLQYKILTPGTGRSPLPTDTVVVNYRGTLIDGTEFDSSYRRNQPFVTPLNQVIPGWTEGLQLIKEGGKIQLVIPPDLAYGKSGAGGLIGPDETLLFEIELVRIQ